jgi:hypothetical protein
LINVGNQNKKLPAPGVRRNSAYASKEELTREPGYFDTPNAEVDNRAGFPKKAFALTIRKAAKLRGSGNKLLAIY